MENQDSERETKPERLLDSRKKIQTKNLSLRNKLPIQKRDDKSLTGEPDDSANYSKANKNSASTSNLGNSKEDNLTEKNDSLCDFRSPVKDNELNESVVDFKVKPAVLKSNKRLSRKESKSVVSKKRRNRDASSNVKQPSIESSFFKPQTTVKTAFLCPLCFKSYKDATTQHNHMKSCAAKNKISTDKLLDAVQLQEKQANERKALGLLAAPPIQPKRTISRKLISEKDLQLQLALALSMSLHEAQVTEEFEDAHLLAGETCLPINSDMSEERRKTLQNFGFTTNKPATASTSSKSRKKRPAGPTALQIRTQEERDRLVTVRIAEVLMGDEAVTQALLENVKKVSKSEENIVLKSRLLRSYQCVKDRLWEKTQQCLNAQNLYSCNLFEISLCKVKPEPEIKELDQETPIQDANNAAEIVYENTSSSPMMLESASKSSIMENKKVTGVKQKTDENSVMNLSKDWKCMLGASYMSDVLVIVKGNFQIHAHQIVFWARCCDILKDVTRRDPERLWEMQQRILWPETEALSAEAFLEYIYCGVIDRYVSIFEHPDMLAGVRVLARKYRLKKLFVYLRDKSNELKSEQGEISDQRVSKANSNLEYNNSDNNSSCLSKEESSTTSVKTDINSVSTVCNYLTSNKPVIDERSSDSDNVTRTNLKSTNVEQKENISHNLVVDCFSSSNDSFAKEIPTTSLSSKTMLEKLSGRVMGETISTNVATGFAKTTDIESLTRNTLSPGRTNHDAVHNNDNNVKITNKTLEEERCTSPDIFDDSTTDADVEVVSISCRNLRPKSQDFNKKCDKTTDMSQDNNCRKKSEKSEIACPFVSTRRKGRSFKLVSANVGNLNLESDDWEQEKKASESILKQKGEITMAIERIQRLNAKTASESDSECESVEILPKKRQKNPFRVNVADTSSTIEKSMKGNRHSGSDDEIPSKKRNKLSIFEKKIELEAAKNPAMFNLTSQRPASDDTSKKRRSTDSLKSRTSSGKLQTVKLDQQQNKVEIEDRIEPSQKRSSKPDDSIDTIFDLTQDSSRESKLDSEEETYDTNIEDKDLSMFTRYKRKHSHNSINKYRAALKKLSSRTLDSSIKDTDEALSSDDLLSSNDELWDRSNKMKRISFSSRYEYTNPDQSTSNLHRDLSTNMSLRGKEQIDVQPASLSSESNDREQSPVKVDDVELSDLEIDLSDFSSAKSSDQLGNSRVNDKCLGVSTPTRVSGNRIFYDKREVDSFTDIKLDDTEFTIMRDDCGTRKKNISDQDTDTECYIESISDLKQPKTVDKTKRRSDADEDKSSDIYNEETDTGEMEDKNHQPRDSRSKMELDMIVDVTSKTRVKSQSDDQDFCEISSPECEISGIFSPPSTNFDFISNITKEVENPLNESRASSQNFRDSQMNLDHRTPPATSSNSLVSVSTPRKPRDDLNSIKLLNEVSDSEFYDMEFTVNSDSSRTNFRNNKSFDAKSSEVEKRKTIKEKTDKKYYVFESDSSDSGHFKIHKTKSRASISLANRSKAIRKWSIQSRCESITPKEKGSSSSLRSLKLKSVSENVIETKSKRGANLMDDSFDGELARVQTPPIRKQNTSSNDDQTTPQQRVPSENVTPLANYSAMKTPELRKELQKYGLKAQKRHRAKQLLRYIYNELHPLVPVGDKNIASYSHESSSEDERPLPKRLNRSDSLEAINSRKNKNNIDSDCETLASDIRTVSDASNDNEGLENNDYHTLSQSDNSEGLENVFRKLIEVDRSLYNKILAYEPLMLEELHATLKAQGFKCKLTALMDFLDEQCITFRTMANAKKSRTRRKASPKKNQSTQ